MIFLTLQNFYINTEVCNFIDTKTDFLWKQFKTYLFNWIMKSFKFLWVTKITKNFILKNIAGSLSVQNMHRDINKSVEL